MKGSSRRVSRAHAIVCPRCEIGEIKTYGLAEASCDFCGRAVNGAVLESLRQIASLPEAVGSHACECGHPEMRRLPDGVYRCPACGSEVLPLNPSWST
jgi:ribosomal protein L37AE/L43A